MKNKEKFLEKYRKLCNKHGLILQAIMGDGCGHEGCCEPGKEPTLILKENEDKIAIIEDSGPNRDLVYACEVDEKL